MRLQTLDEVVGQPVAVSVARALLMREGGYAALLAGPTGTGKSTLARLIAKARLCDRPQHDHSACGECPSCDRFEAETDDRYLYVDCSSVGGVDAARRLSELLQSPSTFSLVVVLDEAQELTSRGKGALLIALEHMAPLSVCLVVTTDIDALGQRISSRLKERIHFERPSAVALADYSRKRDASLTESEIDEVVNAANGSFRQLDVELGDTTRLRARRLTNASHLFEYLSLVLDRTPVGRQIDAFDQWNIPADEKTNRIAQYLDWLTRRLVGASAFGNDPVFEQDDARAQLLAEKFAAAFAFDIHGERSLLTKALDGWSRVDPNSRAQTSLLIEFANIVQATAGRIYTTVPAVRRRMGPAALDPRPVDFRLPADAAETLWDTASVLTQLRGTTLNMAAKIEVEEAAHAHQERSIISDLTHRMRMILSRASTSPFYWMYVRERETSAAVARITFSIEPAQVRRIENWFRTDFVADYPSLEGVITLSVQGWLETSDAQRMLRQQRILSDLLATLDRQVLDMAEDTWAPMTALVKLQSRRDGGPIEGRRWAMSGSARKLAEAADGSAWYPLKSRDWGRFRSGDELKMHRGQRHRNRE